MSRRGILTVCALIAILFGYGAVRIEAGRP